MFTSSTKHCKQQCYQEFIGKNCGHKWAILLIPRGGQGYGLKGYSSSKHLYCHS